MSSTNKTEPRHIILRAVSDLKPHPQQALMPPLLDADYEALKADIKVRGIQTPLIITKKGFALCGQHRLRVAQELGIVEVPVIIVDDLSPAQEIEYIVLDNLNRRHLSPGQRAAIITNPKVAAALNTLKEQARQRQVDGGKAGGKKAGRARANDRLEEIAPQAEGKKRGPQVRDLIGKRADVSGKLVVDAQLVWEKAPDRMAPILKGDKKPTLSGLARELRGKKSIAVVSGADARALVLNEITLDGQYTVDLVRVFRLSAKSLGFVWVVITDRCADAILLQRVKDTRDNKGRIGSDSDLGRLIRSLIPWPEMPKIEVAALLGKCCRLDVRFVKGKPKITIVPDEDADDLTVEDEHDDALPAIPGPEESATAADDAAPVTPQPPARSEPETSPARRKPLWPGSDNEEHLGTGDDGVRQTQKGPPPTGEDHQDERCCHDCGEVIADAPAGVEKCADCESMVVEGEGE